MRSFAVISIVAAGIAAGNPIITTIINEFGFDADGLGWMELHPQLSGYKSNRFNWLAQAQVSFSGRFSVSS